MMIGGDSWHERGRKARIAGAHRDANPYHGDAGEQWHKGWRDEDDSIRRKQRREEKLMRLARLICPDNAPECKDALESLLIEYTSRLGV